MSRARVERRLSRLAPGEASAPHARSVVLPEAVMQRARGLRRMQNVLLSGQDGLCGQPPVLR